MFHIIDIVAGWFVFEINSVEDAFEIDCSKCADIDVGRQFLDIANGLSKRQLIQRYMCLNSEQYVYRMELQTNSVTVKIQICEIVSGEDASVTAFRFINATPSALDFATVKPPVFIAENDAFEFAMSIYKEFLNLDKEKYEKNWFPFPQAEFEKLNQYMRYRI